MVKVRVFAPWLAPAGIGQLRGLRERKVSGFGLFFAWFALGLEGYWNLSSWSIGACCARAARVCANGQPHGNCPPAQRFSPTAALPLLTCYFSSRQLSSWHT